MKKLDEPCPLCDRPLSESWDKHHLKPKMFSGGSTTKLHKMCHRKIHSVFTERELDKYYHTVERLMENEEICKFIKWINGKDPDFYQKTKDTKERKGKRRR